jgi:uncharacterized protein
MHNILTAIALGAIKLYQTYISPYKGFSCAHRVATNETSCSGYGAKVIQRFGLFTGYKLLKRRFYDCKWHAQHKLKTYKAQGSYLGSNLRSRYQRGSVDCDCDCPDIGDAFDCCDFPDDCGGKKKDNYSADFSAKRDRKNKQKYNPTVDINSSSGKGVDLNKRD